MQYEIKIQRNLNEVSIEAEVIRKISREKFFGSFQDNNIDIRYLIKNSKEDFNNIGKFNFFLKIMKQNHHINIYESVLFLEEEGHKMRSIVALLSSDNKSTLELELSEKFRLKKSGPTILEKFFE